MSISRLKIILNIIFKNSKSFISSVKPKDFKPIIVPLGPTSLLQNLLHFIGLSAPQMALLAPGRVGKWEGGGEGKF